MINTKVPAIKFISPTSLSVKPFSIKYDGNKELQPASLTPNKKTHNKINFILLITL